MLRWGSGHWIDSADRKRHILKLLVVALVPGAGSLEAQPVITSQPASQAVWAGSNVTLTVAVAGVGPFAYDWHFNGTNLPSVISTVAGGGTAGFLGDGGGGDQCVPNYPPRRGRG